MLTDAEVKDLAIQILVEAVEYLQTNDTRLFSDMYKVDRELIPAYSATSTQGYGSFYCELMPLTFVEKIIRESELLFDTFALEVKFETGEVRSKLITSHHDAENRLYSIRMMSACATFHLIASFRHRLSAVLEESFHDCEIIAKTMLQAVAAQALKENGAIEINADMRIEIEEAATRVANKKRLFLREQIQKLPNVIAERGPGRIPKSNSERERDRDEFEAKIKTAYLKLRLDLGRKPTKTEVAQELHIGGSDTRLTAFGNKLRRLRVDYDQLIQKADEELHE